MGRGKRKSRAGVIAVAERMWVPQPTPVDEKREEGIYSFSLRHFSPRFSFDSTQSLLTVLSNDGKREIETINLACPEAEWVSENDARNLAATYALREGKIECPAVSINGRGNHPLRVEIIETDEGIDLKFYQYKYASAPKSHDLLVGKLPLSALTRLIRDDESIVLDNGWRVGSKEMPAFTELVQAALAQRKKPLKFRPEHYRIQVSGRTRRSLLAE